jgi:GDP-L-fucose synthase
MAQAYRAQYGLNTVVPLPVNLYGPGDHFDLETSHVIPALIRKCVDADRHGERRIVLWGDGTPTREFLYVADCARALVLMAERYDGQEPVNLGVGSEMSIRDLVAKVREATGYTGEVAWDTTRPNGQPRRCLDVSRAAALFGFRAEVPFEEGLARTVAWYRAQADAA